uniref:Fatty acyl-CoA reductase n=1 Tax=Clastoptera arizonana TaxID=38151 RepID=A0A1B6D9A9_9HEMI
MAPTISEFYAGSNIFITGGTGFVGLAVIEKILRTLPDVGNIYLLLRPKKGVEISKRLEAIKNDPVFDRLRGPDKINRFNKLIPVAGDVGLPNLGLIDEDITILQENVHIVIHSAATLDFEASLKTTVNINLLGTRRLVSFCHTMHNFKALVHVSSAYANSHINRAEEIIYPAVEDPAKVIELANSLSDATIEEITPTLLNGHPNTYTFTKSLAELEVSRSHNTVFLTCIVRPSMIIGAWKEPFPGWTNSKNGPQGFIMGAAKGVVRRLPLNKNLVYDYIPVDVVVNQILTGAWHVFITKPLDSAVFQCTTSEYKPFRWVDVENQVNTLLHKYPLSKPVWYPTLKFLPSLLLFRISAVIFHLIPAMIIDSLSLITGGKRILMRLHSSINKSLGRLAPFIFSEWFFSNKKSLVLHQSLTSQDQLVYYLDVQDLLWGPYFEDLTKGVRKYLNNDDLSTLEISKKKR